MGSTGTRKGRARLENLILGHASLTEDEKEILKWSRERRLEEFQKINQSIDRQLLENKLFYVDALTVGSGEILDVLKLNPKLSWQKVRDVFLGGPVDGYTSTFHGLDEINYPEHFWKVTIENEREKLISA
jgi:hypothetical protein